MGRKDPRVDAYIAKTRPFAQPILKQLQKVIHATSPEIVETVKWSHPAFDYKGPLCGFAAFKEHAVFGFWKHALVVDKRQAELSGSGNSLGRLTSVKDLPSDARLKAWIKRAMALNEEGVPAPHVVNRKKRKPLPVPNDLKAALAMNAKARDHFEGFSPSAQREYIEWIMEAKAAETRERRLAQAVEWIAEGKHRNWKYESK